MPIDAIDLGAYGEEPTGVLPKTKKKVAGEALTQNVQPGDGFLPLARAQLTRIQQERTKFDTEPDDYSQLQAFAKQQGESGQSAMLNALAAQFAGESFQPVQAQFLRRAAAAQEPIKVSGGILTPDGLLKDPAVARSARQAALERQETNILGQIQRAEQAQRDADDRAERARDANNLRRDAIAARAGTAGAASDARNFKIADNLRGEYLRRADKIQQGTGHAQTVAQLLSDPNIAKDPTKQVSLIFSFGKMLDPESVVREAEYALIANARGLGDQLQQLVPQIQTGARLSPQQLQSMQAIAQTLLQGANNRAQDLDNYYANLAKRRNIDPQDVLPSYRAGGGKVVDFGSLKP